MTQIMAIEGIGPVYAEKLQKAGVSTVEELLEKGATRQGRLDLCEQSGIDHALILRWVNHADLYRINGLAGQYTQLLEAAGVDTVVELARRDPQNLLEKLQAVNQEKNLVNRLPGLAQVEKWIAEAKTLPRVVTY